MLHNIHIDNESVVVIIAVIVVAVIGACKATSRQLVLAHGAVLAVKALCVGFNGTLG